MQLIWLYSGCMGSGKLFFQNTCDPCDYRYKPSSGRTAAGRMPPLGSPTLQGRGRRARRNLAAVMTPHDSVGDGRDLSFISRDFI